MDPVVSTVGRVALALLLLAAARHKLRDPTRFAAALEDYRVLPRVCVSGVARSLPFVELSLSAALLVPFAHQSAALGVAGLLTIYTGGIALNLARGRREIDCGCGGPAEQRLRPALLARNALLVAVAVLSALPTVDRAIVWLDMLTMVVAVGVVLLLWQSSRRLADLAFPDPSLSRRPAS